MASFFPSFEPLDMVPSPYQALAVDRNRKNSFQTRLLTWPAHPQEALS